MQSLVNKIAPDFQLLATDGKLIQLQALKGRNLILYFYPKSNTPGCTKQAEYFRDHHADFAKFDAVVLGISRDSLRSQQNFKAKYELPFDLLSDVEEQACRAYEVIQDKKLYGKMVRGIERSTFLIDKNGLIRHEWRKVKVAGHIEELLQALATL